MFKLCGNCAQHLFIDRKMNFKNFPDSDPTMAATKTFELILEQIQRSNLNFQLQLSPYSALISFKKSLIKDKSGCYVMPPKLNVVSKTEALNQKILHLENGIEIMKRKYEESVNDCAEAHKSIRNLENKLESLNHTKLKVKKENENIEIQNLFHKIDALDADNKRLEAENTNLADKVNYLEDCIETQKQISDKMKVHLTEQTAKSQKEKDSTIKEFKAEVKFWKKELGFERKEKISLEKKLEHSEDAIVTLKNLLKVYVNLESQETFCQTDSHPDIPYEVNCPLPPIFSSQLCLKSRRIFLSDSLPNLDSVCWSKPDEDFTEEAEEALNDQYDRQIREFYEDERDRVHAARVSEQLHQLPDHHHPPKFRQESS